MLGFETLTFAPIDRRLIDTDMLSRGGARLAQRYHAAGAGEDRAESEGADRDWLEQACAPL